MGTILIHPTRDRHDRARLEVWARYADSSCRTSGSANGVSAGHDALARRRLLPGSGAALRHHIGTIVAAMAALGLAMAVVAIESLAMLAIATVLLCAVAIFTLASQLARRVAGVIASVCAIAAIVGLLADPEMPGNAETLLRAIAALVATSLAACVAFRPEGSVNGTQARALPAELAQEAVLMRDADGIITFWSRGAERLYGWTRDEAVGRDAEDILRTQPPASFRPLPLDGCWEGDLVRIRRDGMRVVVRCRWTRPPEASDRSIASVEVAVDVTNEYEALDALESARADLAHATRVRSLGEFSASIVHEVNQPLSAMVTNGEACRRWLERDTIDIEAVRSSIDKMIANGRRASDVIACLRSFACPSASEAARVNVNDAVDDVLRLLRGEAAAGRVALRVELDQDIPMAWFGRVELQQVLVNLVMNAVQALETVDGRPRELSVSTRASRLGNDVLVEVSDNGPGFDWVDPERLFESFYTTKSGGMGMGLAICRSMLEKYGGRIEAGRAANGLGARFMVQLRCSGLQSLPA